ncbi:MAG: glycine cleavage system aminomethyltransferase GcvT [Candidatus Lokiarchaeota archaeon]|nr:glycine cleavage system aminomethyltransferase GcvT [Candidatus Lokiarchaeota archaeon]
MDRQNNLNNRTPLYEIHQNLGARMVNFSGWLMPIQYESIIKEHEAVRSNAGVFDISHMGEFLLSGKDVFPFLQNIMVNDLNLLEESKGQYSCMCYENGTVVDDVFYYEESRNLFRIIVNAGNIQKDFQWLNDHIKGEDVKIQNLTSKRSRLAFQGPKSDDLLQSLVDIDLSELKRFYFKHCKLNDASIFLARTGYTGERGFEISFEKDYSIELWNDLLKTGASPAGLGARDSLRLEAAYSLYGHEISDTITPIEAGLNWVVKPKEGIDYIGKDILLKQKSKGTERTLVGLNLLDKGIIRQNYKIFKNSNEIGYVTSGGYSPTLKKTIGLGLVKTPFKEVGTELEIEIRGKLLKGIIVSTPFYRNV